MSELKRFSGYQAVQSTVRDQLPVGGYVAQIIGVKMDTTKFGTQRMVFQVEIAEGEHKGFYRRDYDAQKGGMYEAKYHGVYSINYPTGDGSERDGWSVNRFNRTMGAIEGSNPGYTWDWNLNSLKGKAIGIVVRESEYNDNIYTEIGNFVTVDSIHTGKFKLMKRREQAATTGQQAPQQTAAGVPDGFTPVEDEEIPF